MHEHNIDSLTIHNNELTVHSIPTKREALNLQHQQKFFLKQWL